ncbi:MAG: ATP-binding protein [Pseudomonadota bacterium]
MDGQQNGSDWSPDRPTTPEARPGQTGQREPSRIWPETLRARFFAIAAPLSLLVIAATTLVSDIETYRAARARIVDKLDHLSANQTVVLSRAFTEEDPRLITLMAAGMMADFDVVHVRIDDAKGNPIVTLGQPPEDGASRTHTIRQGGLEPAGTLTIGMDFTYAHEMLSLGLRRSALAGVLALAAVWLGGYVAFRGLVGQPLQRLHDAILAWQRGAPVTLPENTEPDELGALTRAFAELQSECLRRQDELEAIRSELEERVKARTSALALARDEAEAASRAKAAFLAAMSHEIRTPMNALLGMAKSLSDARLPGPERQKVETILDSGRGLATLLNDVLDLSKIEAGHMDLNPVSESLPGLLRRLSALWRPETEAKGVEFILRIDQALPETLVFDPIRVRQCVSNLLSNAVKFTEAGRILVTAAAQQREDATWLVEIAVTDTGIGIAPEVQAQLFSPFTQAESNTTRRFGGTGLGLTISRDLAQLMGGDLKVASRVGEGACFTLSIQAMQASRRQSGDGASERASEDSTSLQGLRVLVVDDVETNRAVVRLLLEPHGLHILEAANGQDALGRLRQGDIDLVLLDLHMPGMDGRETVARIRSGETGYPDVPVIALTADARDGQREALLSSGMNAYVVKPLDIDVLVAEIRLLRWTAGQRLPSDRSRS